MRGDRSHAACMLRAASSQPLIFSMSGGSPLRSRRWPAVGYGKRQHVGAQLVGLRVGDGVAEL